MVATSTLKHFVIAALIAAPTVYAAPVRLSPDSAHGLDRCTNVVEDHRETSLPHHEQLQVRAIELGGVFIGKKTPEQRQKRMEQKMKALKKARDKEIDEAGTKLMRLCDWHILSTREASCELEQELGRIERDFRQKVAKLRAKYGNPSTASAQHPGPVTNPEHHPSLSRSSSMTLVGR